MKLYIDIPNVVLREFESRAVNGAGKQGTADVKLHSTQNQNGQEQAVDALVPQFSGQGNSGVELTVADVLFAVWACMCILQYCRRMPCMRRSFGLF